MSKLNKSAFNQSSGTKRSQQSWSTPASGIISFLRLRTPLSVLSLVALMGLGGTFWLSSEANAQNARTRPAQTADRSNIARVNLTLNRQPNESYDTLVRRAEAAARETAQRSFNQNGSLGAVAVTVMGQNSGSVAPLLSLEVNRQNWASRPDTQRWATYFKNAQSLLRIETPNANVATQPANSTPGQVLPDGTVVPGNSAGQVLPNGTVVPGNSAGQVLPNGTVVPGNSAGQVLPNGSIIPGGTTNGTGQVLPNGSVIPGGTPAGTTFYNNTGTGTTNSQGFGSPNTSGTANTGTTGGGVGR